MLITLKLVKDAALALHEKGPHTESSSELVRRAGDLGLSLKPVHPNTPDAELQTYFHVSVDNPDSVSHVLTQFRSANAVEAAYVKPPESFA
jgi:hypothetical protein